MVVGVGVGVVVGVFVGIENHHRLLPESTEFVGEIRLILVFWLS